MNEPREHFKFNPYKSQPNYKSKASPDPQMIENQKQAKAFIQETRSPLDLHQSFSNIKENRAKDSFPAIQLEVTKASVPSLSQKLLKKGFMIEEELENQTGSHLFTKIVAIPTGEQSEANLNEALTEYESGKNKYLNDVKSIEEFSGSQVKYESYSEISFKIKRILEEEKIIPKVILQVLDIDGSYKRKLRNFLMKKNDINKELNLLSMIEDPVMDILDVFKYHNRNIYDYLISIDPSYLEELIHDPQIINILDYNRKLLVKSLRETRNFDEEEMQSWEILPPDETARGILIVDSGIDENHPILRKSQAIAYQEDYSKSSYSNNVSHGTAVAGCALFGNIEESRINKKFESKNFIYSAKIPEPEEKLLVNIIQKAIEDFLDENPHIKVVNLSLGDPSRVLTSKSKSFHFPLANVIDYLSFKYKKVVFVISAGNNIWDDYDLTDIETESEISGFRENYLNQLLNNTEGKLGLIDPAPSQLGITVGSITKKVTIQTGNQLFPDLLDGSISREGIPSYFSRVGPGYRKSLKPEVMEWGANYAENRPNNPIKYKQLGAFELLLNDSKDNQIFALDQGTSFSAPKISRSLGIIANEYPEESALFLKNLLMQSSSNKKIHQSILSHIEELIITLEEQKKTLLDNESNENKEIIKQEIEKITELITEHQSFLKDPKKNQKILFSTGYGVPNPKEVLFSSNESVILIDEGRIKHGKFMIYPIEIPQIKGMKTITVSVSLTYNSIYTKNQLSFDIKKGTPEEILLDMVSETTLIPNESLTPGSMIYGKSYTQKAERNFSTNHINNLCVLIYNKPNKTDFLKNKQQRKLLIDPFYDPADEISSPYCISLKLSHTYGHKITESLYDKLRSQNNLENLSSINHTIKPRLKIK